MTTPAEPSSAEFRSKATDVYGAVMVGLAVLALGAAGLGWLIGDIWGLLIGGVLGVVVAGAGAIAATLLWAMTQDGA